MSKSDAWNEFQIEPQFLNNKIKVDSVVFLGDFKGLTDLND
jgi:hypothetical protein